MRFLWTAAVLSLLLITTKAGAPKQTQSPRPAPAHLSDARPTGCADRSAVLGGITQSVPSVEPIIVIARPGEGDTRSDLGWRRLLDVRAYWTKFLPAEIRRKPETIILGVGERVGGFGRLEFYTGGKLSDMIALKRNEDLFVGWCYPPDDSYIRNGVFDPCDVKENKIFSLCRDGKARGRRPTR